MELKIVSTGNHREVVGNITDYLKNNIEYDITECELDKNAIPQALTDHHANVAILCLKDEDENSIKVYNAVNEYENALTCIVIVVANEEDFTVFMEHTELKNIQYVSRPVSRSSIFYKLEDIKEMFETGEFAFAEAPKKPAGGTSSDESTTNDDPGLPAGTRRKHILIVDDDAQQLTQLKSHLDEYYHVTAVRSGPAAFKYLENHSADLILLDYIMPGMDGPTVLSRLRDDERYKNIPIIFLTGVSEKETIVKTVVQLKPQGYIVKPAKKSEIIAKIIDVLG